MVSSLCRELKCRENYSRDLNEVVVYSESSRFVSAETVLNKSNFSSCSLSREADNGIL